MKVIYCNGGGEEYKLAAKKISGETRYYNPSKYFVMDKANVLYSDTDKEGYMPRMDLESYFTVNTDGELLFSNSEQLNYMRAVKF